MKITSKQRGLIFGLKNDNGISDEDFNNIVYRNTGGESLRDITTKEASKIIEELKGNRTIDNKCTKSQIKFILGLAKNLDFKDGNLAKFMQTRFNIVIVNDDIFKNVDKAMASKIIEALKCMNERTG